MGVRPSVPRDRRARRGRTRVLTVTLALTTASAFLVGSAASAPAASSPKQGGEITYGLEAETGGGWCPASARLAISGIMVVAAIYDTLTVPNTKNEIVPYLAKSVTSNADSTEWVVTLRDGITFHDGTPLDATAVKGALDAYRQSTLIGTALKNMTDVRVDSPTQLTITTAVPWPELPWALYFDGRIGIVAPAQLADPATCPTNLIGTGPFKLGHWTVNQELGHRAQPRLLAEGRQGHPAPLPRQDHLQAGPRGRAAGELPDQGGQLDVIHTTDGQQIDALEQQASNQYT